MYPILLSQDDNYATVEVDSAALNKQVEEWAANGFVKQEEAQWTKEDEYVISSGARERVVEVLIDWPRTL